MKFRHIVAVVALAVSAASLPAAAEDCLDLMNAPPDPLVESPPPSPGDGYVWAPGYWDCAGEGQEWIPGEWIPGQPGYFWQPHRGALGRNHHHPRNPHHGEGHEGSHAGSEGGGHER